MRMTQTILTLMTCLFLISPLWADSNCLNCHSEWENGDEGMPSTLWTYDIHREKGLGCQDCHGGDPTLDDMDDVRKSSGYRGVPSPLKIPEFCGRCHADANYMKQHNPALPVDQLEKYWTSRHGQLLKRGDAKVANCVSCHSVHNIAPAKLPSSSVYPINLPETCAGCHADPEHMSDYGIPTDQYEKFAASVHGVALLQNDDIGAPACNDCHGNHGAVPPGVDNISAVCGLCHAKSAMLFEGSPHQKAFQEADLPQCETCHSNHDIVKPTDEMVGTEPGSFCIDCHNEGDKGYQTAGAISTLLDSLVMMEKRARAVIEDADRKGMEVDDESFAIKDIHSSLVESRALVHAFNLEKIEPELAKGITLADGVYRSGLDIIGEYYFRRKGLGAATIIIALLAIFIWVKIRRMES